MSRLRVGASLSVAANPQRSRRKPSTSSATARSRARQCNGSDAIVATSYNLQAGTLILATPSAARAAGRRRRAGSVRQLVVFVRVEPPIVPVGQGLLRLGAHVPLGSIGVRTGNPVERAVVSIF